MDLSNPVKESQPSSSFTVKRLQVIDGLEICSSSQFLDLYKHIWCNPHWYEDIHSQHSLSKNSLSPTIQQVKGAKRIQNALIHYIYTPIKENSVTLNETLSITSAIKEICKRLIDSRGSTNPLQAIIETKRILAFVSADQVHLLKSPRTLRSMLWKNKLKFASIFGHSSDLRTDINLLAEDMDNIMDTTSNFPGCVRWKQLLESSTLAGSSRSALEKWKEILIFDGFEETNLFLNFLLKHAASAEELLKLKETDIIGSKNESETFDFGYTKRIITNFPFRGGQLGNSKLVWSTNDKQGLYCIKLLCSLVPASQNEIVKGMGQLADGEKFSISFSLSQDYSDIWTLFQNFSKDDALKEQCPEISKWLSSHAAVQLINQDEIRSGKSSFSTPNIEVKPANKFHSETVKTLCIHNESDSTATPSTGATFMTTPSIYSTDYTDRTLNEFVNKSNLQSNLQITEQESLDYLYSVEKSQNSTTFNEEQTPMLKKPARTRVIMKESKRVGPAPVFRLKTASRLKNKTKLELESSSTITDDLPLSKLIPSKYIKALTTIQGKTAMYVGDFHFLPLAISIPFEEFFGNAIYTKILKANRITYLIVSSLTSRQYIELLSLDKIYSEKLRSPYWYSVIQQSDKDIENNSLTYAVSPYLSLKDNVFQNINPLSTSRSVFFLVTDPALADLVAPLSARPESRVLLNAKSKSLTNWLKQMKFKQSAWEAEAENYLNQCAHDESKKEELIRSCPSFQVHALVILPYYVDTEELATNTLTNFNESLLHSKYWNVISENLDTLRDIQRQYLCTMPLKNDKSLYRLNIWILPLNYLVDCYSKNHLVEGDSMLQWALKYVDSKFVRYTFTSHKIEKPDEYLESTTDTDTVGQVLQQATEEDSPLIEEPQNDLQNPHQQEIIEKNTEEYYNKAVLINKSNENFIEKTAAKTLKKKDAKKEPSILQPTNTFLPFRSYLKAINTRMKKAFFDKNSSFSSQILQKHKSLEKRSSEKPDLPTDKILPSRYSEPPMYTNDSIQPPNSIKKISLVKTNVSLAKKTYSQFPTKYYAIKIKEPSVEKPKTTILCKKICRIKRKTNPVSENDNEFNPLQTEKKALKNSEKAKSSSTQNFDFNICSDKLKKYDIRYLNIQKTFCREKIIHDERVVNRYKNTLSTHTTTASSVVDLNEEICKTN